MKENPQHPLGSKAKVLLTSVFGPYAQDDEYGSRIINPMELFHNQVTRVQGPFSLRMFHPSLGLMMIQESINAPCTLLDFPVLDRFVSELKNESYDIIGISSILPNLEKVKKMCALIREHQPQATIVIGGHIANLADLDNRIDADFIVKGEGVRWFRKFLREDENAPVKHPCTVSAFGNRILGVRLKSNPGNIAAALIPSVGCPMGCNFCSTSHLFGGKGKSVVFFKTGDELFSVISEIEKKLKVHAFFIMDENFLLNRKRTLRLLELMEQHNKSWSFRIFSSARVIESYTDEQLIRLGVSWLWLGLEGEGSQYSKLNGVDTKSLVKRLQTLGIRVLGSTIIGLEDHTPDNIQDAIDWAVSHDTVFHQFMLYLPLPGTPLYKKHKKNDTLLSEKECPIADSHGQYRFNFKHKHIKNMSEIGLLLNAFQQDFDVNGPSIYRLIRTTFIGWKNLKDQSHPSIRERVMREYHFPLSTAYAGGIWAIKKWYRKRDNRIYNEVSALLSDIYKEFGWKTRMLTWALGPSLYLLTVLEDRRLARGWTYEPPTKYTKNAAAIALYSAGAKAKKRHHALEVTPALNLSADH